MSGMQVSFPPETMAAIAKAVERGEFASREAVVAEVLRVWVEDRADLLAMEGFPGTVTTVEQLRAKLEEAIADPRPYVSIDEVFDELEAEYVALSRQRG